MLVQILQFLLSLSLLVLIHEFGHFIFAKIFGVRVEKFYIFFNPWFSLWKKKIGETEYGIGWIPLGGYVKLSGMIDESMDLKQMKSEPKPYEFRAKPAWQRLIIMLGGILMNFLLAFIIYIAILKTWGTEYLPANEVRHIMVDSTGYKIGLRDGDQIIAVNGHQVKRFRDIFVQLILNDPHSLTIVRDSDTINLRLSDKDLALVINHGQFFTPAVPFVISDFVDSSVAKKAGLKKGDKIIAIDGQKVDYFTQGRNILLKHKGDTITLTVLRNKHIYHYKLRLPKSGKLGVMVELDLAKYYKIKTEHYTLLQAIPAGIKLTFKQIADYLKQFKLIFNPQTKAYKSIGSFISIGRLFPRTWDWMHFWSLTAFISIILGVINLLPIPGLDGGHALFAIWEIITGRKPSDKFLEYAQIVGMAILLMLLLLAFWNDITRFVIK